LAYFIAGKNKNTELGPPKVTTKPDMMVGVEAGGVVVLKCCAEANPPAKFKWYALFVVLKCCAEANPPAKFKWYALFVQ
jgi:hypothetical protein